MFDYSYNVAYAAAKEPSILSREALSRMAADGSDAVRQLIQYGYGGEGATVSELTDRELSALRAFIMTALPEQLYRLLILPYDAHNLKVLLKCAVSGADASPYLYDNTVYDTEILSACCRGGEFSLVSEEAAKELNPAYDSGVLSAPFGISSTVDRVIRAEITRSAKNAPEPVFKFITAETDGKNLISYYRSRNTGLSRETLSQVLLAGGELPEQAYLSAFDENAADLRAYTFGLSLHDAFCDAAEACRTSVSSAADVLDSYALSKLEPYRYETNSPVPLFLYFKKKTAEARHVREMLGGSR